MKIAIAQPTYLPWLGYFDLMDQVDCFVFLDSVQFERQSWQQRNRIKTPTGLQWLTVPVVFRGRLGQQIKDVEIRAADFAQEHLRAIELNYRRSPYFDLYFPQLIEILRLDGNRALVDLNLRLIEWFCRILRIEPTTVRSSTLGEKGRRCELLANICRRLEADLYMSALGSAAYLLEEIGLFSTAGIQVAFQHYEHPRYKQFFPLFCPYASALDLLFNEGERSMDVIRSGRRDPFTPEHAALARVAEVSG
jgi:hypothetical protein